MPNKRFVFTDFDDLIERYRGGESAVKLAKEIGCADRTIRNRLREAGVEIRAGHDHPPYVEAANAARRGQIDSIEARRRRAATRQARGLGTSKHEDTFAAELDWRGITYHRQTAIHTYNVDFTLATVAVAVEIVGGGYNPRVVANAEHRREQILDAGWHLIEVHHGKAAQGRFVGAAEYVVAFAKTVGFEPPARGEYRMIRADGQPRSSRRPYVHN